MAKRKRSAAGAYTTGRGWRKSIGKRRGADGIVRDARFWLGMDERQAAATALRIEALWLSLNRPIWTAEAWSEAERLRTSGCAQDAPERNVAASARIHEHRPVPMPERPLPKLLTMTLADGIDRYQAHIESDVLLAAATRRGIVLQLRAAKRSPHVDEPLPSIGYEQVEAIVGYWLARPAKLTGSGERISARWARNVVAAMRQLLDWLDAAGHWHAPHRWERAFRLRRRNAVKPRVMSLTIDELAALYRYADERMRLLMLLGLNCGMANMEAATLRRDEVDLEHDVLDRHRQKTGVHGRWQLWPETAEALRRWFAAHPHDGDGLAVRGPSGQPLVWHQDAKRREYIRDGWRSVQDRCEASGHQVRRMSFKYLRKTGATMIRSIAGIEVSEQYLAHAETSTAKWYSVPEPERLTAALGVLRERLTPMFRTSGV